MRGKEGFNELALSLSKNGSRELLAIEGGARGFES